MKNSRSERGFTLVEVAVVLPIVAAVVAVLVVMMIRLTNESIVQRAENRLVIDINRALDTMAKDAEGSYQFMAEVDTGNTGDQVNFATSPNSKTKQGLPSYQSKAWVPSIANYQPHLVFGNYLMSASPDNPSRQIVFPAGGAGCDTGQAPIRVNFGYYNGNWNPSNSESPNTITYASNIDYEQSIFRRTFIETGKTACLNPYEANTCSSGFTTVTDGSGNNVIGCPGQDKLILQGLERFVVFYYTNPNDSTPVVNFGVNTTDAADTVSCGPGSTVYADMANPPGYSYTTCNQLMKSSRKVKIVIKGTRTIAGKTVSYEDSRTVLRLNEPQQ